MGLGRVAPPYAVKLCVRRRDQRRAVSVLGPVAGAEETETEGGHAHVACAGVCTPPRPARRGVGWASCPDAEAQPPSTSPPEVHGARPGRLGTGPETGDSGPAQTVLHLSCLLGDDVTGPDDQRTGRLVDVIARLAGAGTKVAWHPWVTGVVVDFDGQERFAHAYQIVSLSYDGARLSTDLDELGPFERRPGEVLLDRDLRSRHLIHLEGARLVRANEIELARIGTRWQVIGVDTSSRPVLRRVLPRVLRRKVPAGGLVDWGDVQPFLAHVPSARLADPVPQASPPAPGQAG